MITLGEGMNDPRRNEGWVLRIHKVTREVRLREDTPRTGQLSALGRARRGNCLRPGVATLLLHGAVDDVLAALHRFFEKSH